MSTKENITKQPLTPHEKLMQRITKELITEQYIILDKHSEQSLPTMKDLVRLAMETKLTYGLFESGKKSSIIRADQQGIELNRSSIEKLLNNRYKITGFVTNKQGVESLLINENVHNTLKLFKQKNFSICNTSGQQYKVENEPE